MRVKKQSKSREERKAELVKLEPFTSDVQVHNNYGQINLWTLSGQKLTYYPVSEKWRVISRWYHSFSDLLAYMKGELTLEDKVTKKDKDADKVASELKDLSFFSLGVTIISVSNYEVLTPDGNIVNYFPASESWVVRSHKSCRKKDQWRKGFSDLIEHLNDVS